MTVLSTVNQFFDSIKQSKFDIPRSVYPSNYVTNNLDLILQQHRRTTAISRARIFDWIQVENDPNYSRASPINRKKLENLFGKLGLYQSVVTSILGKLQMVGLTKYIPTHFLNMLFNLRSMIESGNRLLPTIQRVS